MHTGSRGRQLGGIFLYCNFLKNLESKLDLTGLQEHIPNISKYIQIWSNMIKYALILLGFTLLQCFTLKQITCFFNLFHCLTAFGIFWAFIWDRLHRPMAPTSSNFRKIRKGWNDDRIWKKLKEYCAIRYCIKTWTDCIQHPSTKKGTAVESPGRLPCQTWPVWSMCATRERQNTGPWYSPRPLKPWTCRLPLSWTCCRHLRMKQGSLQRSGKAGARLMGPMPEMPAS